MHSHERFKYTCKDEIVSGKRKYLLIVASLVVLVVMAACSEEQIPTREPVSFNPTEAPEVVRSGSEPEAPPEVDLTLALVAAGEQMFNDNGCSACHSTGDNQLVGPGLAGVYERAGTRTSLDADTYLEEALREPGAFLADDLPAVMPSFDRFTSNEVENMIAYLKSLE